MPKPPVMLAYAAAATAGALIASVMGCASHRISGGELILIVVLSLLVSVVSAGSGFLVGRYGNHEPSSS